MDQSLYIKLHDQIARQTPELAGLDADIAARTPVVDALKATLDAAQAAHDAAEEADKAAAQAALTAAQQAHAGPRSELDDVIARASPIRAAIAQCQALIDGSGISMTEAEMDAIRNAPVVPDRVTMRQARLALLGAGLLANVDTAINALPEPTKSAARIEWEYSGEVHRDRPFVQTLGGALGLSSAQLDALFVAAAAL